MTSCQLSIFAALVAMYRENHCSKIMPNPRYGRLTISGHDDQYSNIHDRDPISLIETGNRFRLPTLPSVSSWLEMLLTYNHFKVMIPLSRFFSGGIDRLAEVEAVQRLQIDDLWFNDANAMTFIHNEYSKFLRVVRETMDKHGIASIRDDPQCKMEMHMMLAGNPRHIQYRNASNTRRSPSIFSDRVTIRNNANDSG
jgi:hypothetical protein